MNLLRLLNLKAMLVSLVAVHLSSHSWNDIPFVNDLPKFRQLDEEAAGPSSPPRGAQQRDNWEVKYVDETESWCIAHGGRRAVDSGGAPSGNKDGTLKIGIDHFPTNLDPGQNPWRQQQAIMHLVAGTLTNQQPDGKNITMG
ncbi:hypothetical protein BPNPMPFG_007078 (plasmid) [Mesorhizobium sp. AR07]|uniref:hypothetical protein n=1 Tax=Mesorhizobium sp. AR07 TaxID=2865838 RepID=UPI00215F90C1|nr:hypothetical protein [Mesorhizobium sp. AR07]UVK48653.1 hypothetical protein BPNPMPFG_007078 [Mesorhizobium sp. AR07]